MRFLIPAAWKFRFPRLLTAVEFTREGLIFMLLSLAIGAASVNTGNNVLYFIFSLMLGMIIVSGIASRRILQGLEPVLAFPDHVFAGVTNLCYISINNAKQRLPSIAIRFVVREAGFANITRYFFWISPAQHSSAYARVLFPKRGVYKLREMELQTQFPFSFFVKIRRFRADQIVLVYPRVFRLSEDVLSRYASGFIRESPYRGDSQQLLHLRDYTHFDSSKRIHWKASARAEKLLVKEYQREQGRDLYVQFDCFPDDPQHPIQENALSLLASLAFLFKERDMNAKIILAGKTFDIRNSIIPLLTYLAEWNGKRLESSDLADTDIPPDAVVLQIRSRQVRSKLQSRVSGARNLFVEDWQHLMTEERLIAL